MVGTLALVAAKFGAVVSYSLGTLPWLPGKEPLFGIRIDMLSCLMLLVITMVGSWSLCIPENMSSRHNREHPSDAGQDRYYFSSCSSLPPWSASWSRRISFSSSFSGN